MGFKKDFIWGSATASYQIEGAAYEDGRGRSIWDMFSHTHGKVFRDHNGDVACDHYHRVEQDVRLMHELGMRNYRFSVAWPRILPEGRGAVNEKGIAFYDRLIDELLKYDIRPWMTMFHWDYPVQLQARGAWENPDSVQWFTDYAEVLSRRFGDRVKDFITFNEPQCFIGLGYRMARHAPGLNLCDEELVPMTHHVMLAHGRTVQLLRANVPDCRVAYAPCSFVAVPETETPEDIAAAREYYFTTPEFEGWPFSTAWWSDPVMLGSYPEDALRRFERFLPKGWEKDLDTMHQPIDYYCQNIYQGTVIRAGEKPEIVLPHAGSDKTANDWDVVPRALYWGPRFLYERYRTPFIISENGMASDDMISADGGVHDATRIEFMRRYLTEYRRAADDGVDVAGYFAWSLMDNYEWARGYADRFGLVYVDYRNDCRRIPKDSARWYSGVIASNGEDL